jgi:hypothetical protein
MCQADGTAGWPSDRGPLGHTSLAMDDMHHHQKPGAALDLTLVELRSCIETALSGNPLESILATRRARKLLAWLEAYTVDRARDAGWSWGRIAQYLGIAKQTLHRQHAKRAHTTNEPPKREAVTFEERAREHEAYVVELLATRADRRGPPDAA